MIAVVGSSNTDFSLRVEKLPAVGETVLGKELFISGGGKGANQAACIAKLGGEVNFIANIGAEYFGNLSIKNLDKVGVDTRFVKKDRIHHSGTAFILIDKCGRNMIAVSAGSNMFLKASDIIKRADCIKKSRILLLQCEVPIEAVKAAVYLAKRFNKLIILNPAPACKISKDILSKVDVLIPNEIELSMLTGVNVSDTTLINRDTAVPDTLRKAATLLLKTGVGCVIITLGKKGVLLVTKGKTKFFKAKKVKVVDTTCAGDAFCGAFAFGLDNGKSIEEAIEFATCVAALTCTKVGAQSSLPTLKRVTRLL
ncbi:MAG: ribokinase [Candidatus Omnitrophica bacterium]|nr:ribokinase [Candidatus Omnitrophota bacterium]